MSRYLTTGDHNFDYLFGGLTGKGIEVVEIDGGLVGTSVLIDGYSGTGKTILACQLSTRALQDKAFQGSKGIIYSLDQRPEELARLLRGFNLINTKTVGALEFKKEFASSRGHQGIKLFIKHVKQEHADISALWAEIQNDQRDCKELKIVVVDTINSLLKLRAAEEYPKKFRELVELSQDAKLGGMVLILTLEKLRADPMLEEYVPNCVIELSKSEEPGLGRSLEVKKVRNQQHYIGTHDFDISEHGIVVFPSLHARSQGIRPARSAAAPKPADYIPFGYQGIDDVIAPGLDRGSTTLLWGAPGTYKTNLCAKFLLAGLADKSSPNGRALFMTFKIEPAAFRRFLGKEEKKQSAQIQPSAEARTDIIDARDPFELPTSVFTRIMKRVQECEDEKHAIERAVVFGLRRLDQLPAYHARAWHFLEVLVSFLQSHRISTLLVDWPEEPTQVAPPIAIDLCASEIKTSRNADRVVLDIRRRNYELVGKPVDYGE